MTDLTKKPRAEAKRILAAIVQLNGGRFSRKTSLLKAFYWAHRFYWEESPGALTTWPIVAQKFGQVPEDWDDLLMELYRSGIVDIEVPEPDSAYPEWYFTTKAEVVVTPAEEAAIRKALSRVVGRSAKAVSDDAHENGRTWVKGQYGVPISVELDSLSDEEYAELEAGAKRATEGLDILRGNIE